MIGPGFMPSRDRSVASLSKVHHKRSRVPLRRDPLSSTLGGEKLVLVSLTQIPGQSLGLRFVCRIIVEHHAPGSEALPWATITCWSVKVAAIVWFTRCLGRSTASVDLVQIALYLFASSFRPFASIRRRLTAKAIEGRLV